MRIGVFYIELNAEIATFKSVENDTSFNFDIPLTKVIGGRNTQDEVVVDHEFMNNTYGVDLSEFDIERHSDHRFVWKSISERYDVGLVMESTGKYKGSWGDILKIISELPKDFHVYLPVNPFRRKSRAELNDSSIFGNHSDFYLISKSGAYKLIGDKVISRPVIDNMIFLANHGLSVYFESNDLFVSGESIGRLYSRQKSIERQIFRNNCWGERERTLARLILSKLSEIASLIDIKLSLSFGTLLGHIRHGGMMPWDDDIDISINSDDLDLFLRKVRVMSDLRFGEYTFQAGPMKYFKFWLDDCDEIPKYDYRHPFVDLWVYTIWEDKEKIVYLEYENEFPIIGHFPLMPTEFEGAMFFVPNNPQSILDRSYPDWRHYIQVYTWSHREEKEVFNPLRLAIQVDKSGRYLGPGHYSDRPS